MTELLYPHTHNIFSFHTDGIWSDKPLDFLDIGNDIGQWKNEYSNKKIIIKGPSKFEFL